MWQNSEKFPRQVLFLMITFLSPQLLAEPIEKAPSSAMGWRQNQDQQALALAQLENNYPVAENYIFPHKEDQGFEKVRILQLNPEDARGISRDLASEGQSTHLERFVKRKISRGIKGIELARGRVTYKDKTILVYRYQIQGHPLPLVVSAFGYYYLFLS